MQRAHEVTCWLCGADLQAAAGGESAAARSASATHTATQAGLGSFSLASLMMFVTLVTVVFGVATLWPGVGIPLGLVVLVVWLRTAAVARRRAARGVSLTRSEKVQLFLSSFSVAVGLIAVTCVAGGAAFVAACFACAATWSIAGNTAGMVTFAVVAGAIAIPTLWWMATIIARRWRQDVGER